MRFAVVAFCAITLSACAVRQPKGDVELDHDESMIVMSTRLSDSCGGMVQTVTLGMEVLHNNELKRIPLLLQSTFIKSDFDNPPGMLFNMKVKVGELRFTQIRRVGTGVNDIGEQELDFQMRIEPGKVYYLGELYANINCTDYNIRVNDQRQRDGALFNKRMNTLDASMFEVRLLGTS